MLKCQNCQHQQQLALPSWHLSLLCTHLFRTTLKWEALTLLFLPMCGLYYVFTGPRVLKEWLLRIKSPGTRISWVSQPPFTQPSPVDPQVENSFVTGLSEPLAGANPQAAAPQQGKYYSSTALTGIFIIWLTVFYFRAKQAAAGPLCLQGPWDCQGLRYCWKRKIAIFFCSFSVNHIEYPLQCA